MAVDHTIVRPYVEIAPISTLKMHPKNIEIYGEEDVTALVQSIAESGWIKPLTVTPEHVIVSGHRRYQAAKQLDYTELPVEIEAFASKEAEMERLLRENEDRRKTPEQQIREGMTWEPIDEARAKKNQGTRTDLTSRKILREVGDARDSIARRVGLGSGVTYEKGKTVVQKIDEELATGGVKERGRLLRIKLNDESINAASKLMQNYVQIDEDEAQRLKEEEEERVRQEELECQRHLEVLRKEEALRPRGVQPGQTWRLGRHLLYCGDSSSEQFISLCKQAEASFAFADPPYNAGVAEWDNDFVWRHDYLSTIAPIVAVTPGISAIKDFMRVTDMPYKWSMSYWIDNGMTRGAIGFGNWMYVALFSEGSLYRNGQDLVRIEDKDMKRISITGGDHDDLKHKGRKPIELLCDIINLFTEQGETVVDPFLGTGTTLIASEREGRVCIGAELNVESCEHIIKRWVIATEQEAVLVA
jgi:ParB-like chromosome segregation protein Spo0J